MVALRAHYFIASRDKKTTAPGHAPESYQSTRRMLVLRLINKQAQQYTLDSDSELKQNLTRLPNQVKNIHTKNKRTNSGYCQRCGGQMGTDTTGRTFCPKCQPQNIAPTQSPTPTLAALLPAVSAPTV